MVKQNEPRYSILIPTRNGLKYLVYSIESVLSQRSENFELIVSDNHSCDGTIDYLSSIDDGRFKYVRPPRLLSMTEHFEFVLSQARGEWIALIGDDDGLLPLFFEKMDGFISSNREAESFAFERAYYFWSGCENIYGNEVVMYWPARGVESVNNIYAMFMCVMSVINYTQVPQIYTCGLVKRSLVEKIKGACSGRFFFGRSPDASSAAALSLHSKYHLFVNEPLFWVGTSPKSTGYAHSFDSEEKQGHEFLSLNRQDNIVETKKIPDDILNMQDFAMLFYEALLVHPTSSYIWKTRLVRNLFLAGLKIKRPDLFPSAISSYGSSIYSWEVKMLAPVIRFFDQRRRLHSSARKHYSFGIYSKDREKFPSLREASAAVEVFWKRCVS